MVRRAGETRLRTVSTSDGPITYCLTYKQVKNLNLRVNGRGAVTLSVPLSCTIRQADQMVQTHAQWIREAIQCRKSSVPDVPPQPSREICQRLAEEATARVYPLVQPLGVAFPQVRVRQMRSQWGNCHWKQGYITLNLALMRCPEHLRDYVALHELVHFLHHDHGGGFYATMDRLMPRWREFRKELKDYAGVIRPAEDSD